MPLRVSSGLRSAAKAIAAQQARAYKACQDRRVRCGSAVGPAAPQLSDLYRRKVEALEAALAGGEDSAEAMVMVRIMIDRVVLTPSPAGAGLNAGLHGELAGVLAVCEGAVRMGEAMTHERPGSFEPGRLVSLVAGAGGRREVTLPPVTI